MSEEARSDASDERATLGKLLSTNAELVVGVLSPHPGAPPVPVLTALTATRNLGRLVDDILHTLARQARHEGHTWAELGDLLGTSRQAAYQRFSGPMPPTGPFPPPPPFPPHRGPLGAPPIPPGPPGSPPPPGAPPPPAGAPGGSPARHIPPDGPSSLHDPQGARPISPGGPPASAQPVQGDPSGGSGHRVHGNDCGTPGIPPVSPPWDGAHHPRHPGGHHRPGFAPGPNPLTPPSFPPPSPFGE